jgi:hypothetical protein
MLSRNEFEGELLKRGLPWIRIVDPDYVKQDLAAIEEREREREHRRQRHVPDPSAGVSGSS